ncbi:MAG: hypothetical protein C5B49_10650, partial [Bdellovibrio sp.]
PGAGGYPGFGGGFGGGMPLGFAGGAYPGAALGAGAYTGVGGYPSYPGMMFGGYPGMNPYAAQMAAQQAAATAAWYNRYAYAQQTAAGIAQQIGYLNQQYNYTLASVGPPPAGGMGGMYGPGAYGGGGFGGGFNFGYGGGFNPSMYMPASQLPGFTQGIPPPGPYMGAPGGGGNAVPLGGAGR